VARVVACHTNGDGCVFRVFRSRSGSAWWVAASQSGLRMSATIQTTSKTIAAVWIASVQAGNVSIAT
jgi:hypothetical protein